LRPKLRSRDWDFAEPWPEDHGWHNEALAPEPPKAIGVSLVVSPELDAATPEGGALEGRWRVVIGIDVGWLPNTRMRRLKILVRLAHAVEASCVELGATGFVWEVGGA
jgi:hypothetical protein